MKSRPWYSWLLFGLVVIAVGWFIYRNIGEIRQYDFSYNLWFILLAFAFEILAYLFQFGIWINLSGEYGLKAPAIKAGKGFFLSQLGKYIPGKVGLVLVRMDAYRGYSKKKIAVATGFEMIIALAAACILILVGLISAAEFLPGHAVYGAVAMLAVLLVLLYPPFFLKLVNFGFKLIKREPIEESPSFRTTIKFILAFMLVGLLQGMGLFFALKSLSPVPFEYYMTITAVYYAAGIVGLISFFAPAGIGVREGILMLVLPLFIPEPVVIVGAILIRLLMTAAELTMAGTSTLLEKISHHQ